MPTPFPSLHRRLLGLVAALTLAVALHAEQAQRDYSFADDTSEGLQKYRAAMELKPNADLTAAMAVLDGLLLKVPAESYDAAYLLQLRSQLLIQKNEYAKAIEPIERSLQLSEAKTPTYFDERQTREIYFFLVQLYFQEATQTKNTTLGAAFLDKADKAMTHWIKITPQTNADAQLLYAQLLFQRALALNPTTPDQALLKRAIEQVDIGLKLTTRPKDTFYVLKLVCLNQLDRYAEASELLESLVKQKPDSAAFWQQLAAIYLTMAAKFEEAKDTQSARDYSIRSILAIERAQANGFMNSHKENYNLIGIYFNIGQYEKAAELLTAGLKADGIDNDPKNWELLALCYQQLQRPFKSIEALKDGAKAFPKSGQLELQIGNAYIQLDKPEDALKHIQFAITKGNLTKPYQAYLSLAYTAYNLQKYDIALEAARKAMEFPEGLKDGKNMADALDALIKDREAKKNKT